MTTRRDFLHTSAALFAASYALPTLKRPPLGFSTLGCPTWPWPKILDFAAEHRFAAIELRGILENMDLTRVPELAPDRIADAKQQLAAHGLTVSCLGASAQMHDQDPVKHAAQLDEAHRFIDLAHALDAPYVRVFGNEYVKDVPRDQMLAYIAGALRSLGDYAGPKGVTVLIESPTRPRCSKSWSARTHPTWRYCGTRIIRSCQAESSLRIPSRSSDATSGTRISKIPSPPATTGATSSPGRATCP